MRWVRVVLSTRQDDKIMKVSKWEAKAGTGDPTAKVQTKDVKASTEWDNKAHTEQDDKAGIKKDNETGKRQDHNGVGDLGQDNKRATKPAERAYTEARRFSLCAFFLAAHSNTFLTFLSSKSVIGCPLSTGSDLIASSGLSMMSTNCDALSSRYPKRERWKSRACKVFYGIISKLTLSKLSPSTSQS